jgi:hypothetical protein
MEFELLLTCNVLGCITIIMIIIYHLIGNLKFNKKMLKILKILTEQKLYDKLLLLNIFYYKDNYPISQLYFK